MTTKTASTTEDVIKRLLLRILAEHVGHENRIRRPTLKAELISKLGSYVGDRKMRDMLEEVRSEEAGCRVCGSLKAGYFLARDFDELDKFLEADKHRISKISTRIRNQEKYAAKYWPDQSARLKHPDQMGFELKIPEAAHVAQPT